jgi:hypothetical protein
MLARCHDTAAVQLVEGPQVAVARPIGIDPSSTESIVNPRYYRSVSVVTLHHCLNIGHACLPRRAHPDQSSDRLGAAAVL